MYVPQPPEVQIRINELMAKLVKIQAAEKTVATELRALVYNTEKLRA